MRTPETRALAERALVRLLVQIGPRTADLVVVGGLNPALLAPVADAPHQGTVDVDIALDVAPVYDRDDQDFGWLERALVGAGFEQSGSSAWRWSVVEAGATIHLDVLCDVLDSPDQELVLPGTRLVTAMNLSGPGAAVRDSQVRPVTLRLTETDEVEVRFAGLGGYLLAKAAAVAGRGADKDWYDLAFVVLHNPGGPTAAARAAYAALPSVRTAELTLALRAALSELTDAAATHVVAFAVQRQRDGLPDEAIDIQRDAALAARLCLDEFDRLVRGAS